ncbi:MAG: M23 family metallopeptidase [Blastocatellia bacterium]|nr:M23 family metallopeptidase [Blastocatellia bacterium]
MYGALLSGVILLGLLSTAGVWVMRRAVMLVRYTRIERENEALKREYLMQLNALQSRLASLEAEAHQVRQTVREMGIEVENADPEPTTSNPAGGKGGPHELQFFADEIARVEATLKTLRVHLERERERRSRTPRGWPIEGPLNARFGIRRNPFGEGYEFHTGVDIEARHGEPVRATADGAVVFAAYWGGYGNLVILDHGNGLTTFYGHLSRITVRVGQTVKRGQIVGRAGSTGRSTGPHVHYEVRVNDRPVNPLRFSDG